MAASAYVWLTQVIETLVYDAEQITHQEQQEAAAQDRPNASAYLVAHVPSPQHVVAGALAGGLYLVGAGGGLEPPPPECETGEPT